MLPHAGRGERGLRRRLLLAKAFSKPMIALFEQQIRALSREILDQALADMQSGELLKVLATDGGSLRDFQAFAKQTGNELVEQQTVGEEFIHILRRR